jgi:hypothetical protein
MVHEVLGCAMWLHKLIIDGGITGHPKSIWSLKMNTSNEGQVQNGIHSPLRKKGATKATFRHRMHL